MDAEVETSRLRQEIERALRRAFDPADLLPRLVRLARLAPERSDDGVFAHRQLAELLVERHPWRAALYARRALAHSDGDDRAWAILALSQTLLGNFRCAATAYGRAIASSPANPWYAHNLGHLLDVALGSPERALPWLRAAHGEKRDSSEIAASLVHALARAGHLGEARRVLDRALGRFDSRELEALSRWLDHGARARKDGHPPVSAPEVTPAPAAGAAPRAARSRAAGVPGDRRLTQALRRGMLHLPLDARQQARAMTLARDALADASRRATPDGGAAARAQGSQIGGAGRARVRSEDVAGLAAAVAYAIVYVDHLPLSHAEVAAPFRVAVAHLRGRFAELRAELDLIPGDARYASARR